MTSARWQFTLNNPVEQLSWAVGVCVTYLIWQLEVGDSGTPHFQGYLELSRDRPLAWLKKHLSDEAHFEVAKGTAAHNNVYCTKEEGRLDGPWIEGVAKAQGKRNDLKGFLEDVKHANGDIYKVAAASPDVFMRQGRRLEQLAAMWTSKAARPIFNAYIYGPTGSGKTSFVKGLFGPENVYSLMHKQDKNIWFDGYTNQKVLLIEEFDNTLDQKLLCKVMDIWPDIYPIKGASIAGRWTHVFFCSNTDFTAGFLPEVKRRLQGRIWNFDREQGMYAEYEAKVNEWVPSLDMPVVPVAPLVMPGQQVPFWPQVPYQGQANLQPPQ